MDREKRQVAVSVVMTVHNSMPYLREAMDTVLAQTLTDIEVICVDDGSTDGSMDLLHDYEAKDARVRVLQVEPMGAGSARNIGIDAARGEYLSILDSDDYFELDMLEKSYQKAKQTDADIVMFDFWYVVDGKDIFLPGLNSKFLPLEDVFSPEEYRKTLFQITSGAAWNLLVLRSFVQNEHLRFEGIRHSDDYGFVRMAFSCARRIAILRERLAHYRWFREGSQTATSDRWPLSEAQAFLLLKRRLQEKDLFDIYHETFFISVVSGIRFGMKRFETTEAFFQFFYALKNFYLHELGCFDDRYRQKAYAEKTKFLKEIRDMTPVEFLFHQYKGEDERSGTLPKAFAKMEHHIGGKDKTMVLYGAGDHGKLLFGEMMNAGTFRLADWVDRDFEHIGYPVQSPQRLREIAYDYVLITPLVKRAYESIRRDLLAMGIPQEKILWAGDFEDDSV